MARGVNKANQESISAFWSKVDIKKPHECWNWIGAKKEKGYGNVRINSEIFLSHRVAWELTNFPIPDGYVVMHLCDNPSCCNPSHLALGTSQANNCDKLIKGRGGFHKNRACGTRNTNSKLDENKVREIRRLYQLKKANQYQLADDFGVSQNAIASVVNRKTWRHVE